MKRKCQVCGQENGSCNRYYFSPVDIITICPACLAFSCDDKAKIARRAHKAGRLVKEEVSKKKMVGKSPCRGCEVRRIGCHAICNAFSEWKTEQYKLLEAKRQANLKNLATAGTAARHEKWIRGHK